jgi:HD-GYP domain-containing protein (c-di-GMP phosphodiesterase class II)
MSDAIQAKDTDSAPKIFETSDQNTIERLIKIGTALTVERNLHELLKMIVDELKSLISADKASLFLIDKEKHELIFHITSDEVLREQRLPMSRKSIAGYVAMTGEILRIPDVYELEEASPYKFNKEIDKQTGYRTRSMIALPMIDHKGERIGVIQLINKQVNNAVVPFDGDDERLLNALASQAAVSIENARLYNDIEIFFASFVRALASAIEARDPVTKGHSRRVAMYAEATAKAMNTFSPAELKELLYAAWLHDVGKIGVREYILNKQNKLSDEEIEVIKTRFHLIKMLMRWELDRDCLAELEKDSASPAYARFVEERKKKLDDELTVLDMYVNFIVEKNKPGFMSEADIKTLNDIAKRSFVDSNAQKQPYLTPFEIERLSINKGNLTSLERENMNSHVQYTWDILSEIPFTKELRNVPFYASLHHEKLDGSGYPFGYMAEKIPVQARILAIADIYDALTAQDRPYKKPIPQGKALDIIEEMVQSNNLDREVFITFIKNRIYELEDTGEEFTFLSTILTKAEKLLRDSR